MLRVTLDAFSGLEPPSYVLEAAEAREILREISRNRGAITDLDAGFTGLGFRGAILEPLSDDIADEYDLPEIFKVGAGGSQDDGAGFSLAERLIQMLPDHTPASSWQDAQLTFDRDLVTYLTGLLEQTGGRTATDLDGAEPQVIAPTDVTCYIERGKFNPGFWNRPEVIRDNNCYNYASNWRNNTFAQPGKGVGRMYRQLTCAEVTRAALADGCRRRYDCLPESEKPRWLMALVVGPNYDYHWYRMHTREEGFWGHKPGRTAARNYDNRGRVITNPETADRGPYTHFCGYFYGCNTQRSRIR